MADTVRGILDGHIILSRKIASANHYPAIDIQNSLSRLMKAIATEEQCEAAGKLRENLATYAESKDLIDIGAYQQGSNLTIDEAIRLNKPINDFLRQRVEDRSAYENTNQELQNIFTSTSRIVR